MPLHKCTICGKIVSRSTKLTEHMRSHTGERPFSCTICGRSLSRSYDLTKHKELHSGTYRHKCGSEENGSTWGCGKGFHKKGDLLRHLRRAGAGKCRQTAKRNDGTARTTTYSHRQQSLPLGFDKRPDREPSAQVMLNQRSSDPNDEDMQQRSAARGFEAIMMASTIVDQQQHRNAPSRQTAPGLVTPPKEKCTTPDANPKRSSGREWQRQPQILVAISDYHRQSRKAVMKLLESLGVFYDIVWNAYALATKGSQYELIFVDPLTRIGCHVFRHSISGTLRPAAVAILPSQDWISQASGIDVDDYVTLPITRGGMLDILEKHLKHSLKLQPLSEKGLNGDSDPATTPTNVTQELSPQVSNAASSVRSASTGETVSEDEAVSEDEEVNEDDGMNGDDTGSEDDNTRSPAIRNTSDTAGHPISTPSLTCQVENCPIAQIRYPSTDLLKQHHIIFHASRAPEANVYKCFAPGCISTGSQFKFLVHVLDQHPDQDLQDLFKKSEQWYAAEYVPQLRSLEKLLRVPGTDPPPPPPPPSPRLDAIASHDETAVHDETASPDQTVSHDETVTLGLIVGSDETHTGLYIFCCQCRTRIFDNTFTCTACDHLYCGWCEESSMGQQGLWLGT